MVRPLDQLFLDALRRYPEARRTEKFGRESSLWPLIAEIKAALESVPVLAATQRAKVKVSFGQGAWAEVPNFALMDSRETQRPGAGLYLVYLVHADATGLTLSLNQGSADLIFEAKGRVYELLRARAERVRRSLAMEPLTAAGFTDAPVDIRSTAQYPRAYAAGSIVAKPYAGEAIPSAEDLVADLAILHRAYQSVIPSARLRLGEIGRAAPVGGGRR